MMQHMQGGFTAPVGHHYNHTCFEAGALQQSSPFKAPDADLLANCGSRLLDDGGHRLAGVLDEGLVQQGLLRQELLNAPVHNLAPASRRPLQHEHELLHLIFVYQQGKTRDRYTSASSSFGNRDCKTVQQHCALLCFTKINLSHTHLTALLWSKGQQHTFDKRTGYDSALNLLSYGLLCITNL